MTIHDTTSARTSFLGGAFQAIELRLEMFERNGVSGTDCVLLILPGWKGGAAAPGEVGQATLSAGRRPGGVCKLLPRWRVADLIRTLTGEKTVSIEVTRALGLLSAPSAAGSLRYLIGWLRQPGNRIEAFEVGELRLPTAARRSLPRPATVPARRERSSGVRTTGLGLATVESEG